MIGVTLVMLGLLYAFFRGTRLGLAMRAAAANPESARLVGIRVGWMTALGWGMAAAIGAVAGMLIAPVVFLEPNMMLGVLLYGFAGAVLGGLTSPAGAVAGGFAVGVIENLAGLHPHFRARNEADDRARGDRRRADVPPERHFRAHRGEPGMTMPQKEAVAVPPAALAQPPALAMRLSAPRLVIPAVILVALILPWVATSFVMFQLTQVMIYGLAILGLNLLTGFNGQFSLGHSAFYGIGAYTAAIMMHNYDIGYLWTLPAAGGVCFVVGFLFGLPALRLQNLYLALATFALAIAMPQILKFHGVRGMDRRGPGVAARPARSARLSADRRRPMALLPHACRRAAHVLRRRQT